ncbi:PP2C family protein-serine/threonine phosphatase [Kitasatospora sp. NPDC002040]|uniref:PP2C family protein-serine/threonine phosphatase n=1 Tax=Kitasatospora sp. NPDC002040 TaxID=3154661 RepID=UPI003321ED7C
MLGRPTPCKLLWTGLGSAMAIAAATAPGAVEASADGHRAVTTFDNNLHPADTALRELVAAVTVGCAAPPGHPGPQGARFAVRPLLAADLATDRMAVIRSAARDVPSLAAPVAELERELAVWRSGTAGPGPRWTGSTPVRTDALLAGADRLAVAVDHEYRTVRAHASRARVLMGLHLLAGAVALFVLLVALTAVVWRRFVVPLSGLERGLRAVATGGQDRLPAAPSSWLARTYAEADRVRLQLKEQRWAARRDREALESDGPASVGLRQLLTVTERPGPGVRTHGDTVAAEGLIAGDFLDTVALPGGATALLQGDISGHGVPAGLLAAQVKCAALAALRLGRGPAVAVQAGWSALAREDERFATLAVVVLDPASDTLSWLNAGHEEPFLRRASGEVERLAGTGPLVSSLVEDPAAAWSVRTTAFAPGDLVVLCTDGLTEARNEAGEELGAAAVEAVLRCPAADPAAVVRALYLAAEAHGCDWQRDDVTILAADRPLGG